MDTTIDNALELKINLAEKSAINEVDFNNLQFGKIFSDHMFISNYSNGEWTDSRIAPYGEVSISPSISALQYGQAIFEGLKAFKMETQQVAIFRPEENWKRFNLSAERMCMPFVPKDVFLQSMYTLVKIDRAWVPQGPHDSLYIRPFMFASESKLGIDPADEYTFMIITSPLGAYFNHPLNVKIELNYTRAIEGGVGFAKCAGNYAAAMLPALKAKQEGFDQIIWTDGKEHKYIEEIGAANLLFLIDGNVVSPSTKDGTILKGITKDTVFRLLENLGIKVINRKITVSELIEGIQSGKVREAFTCGTAATVTPIQSITIENDTHMLAPISSSSLSNKLLLSLNNIRSGVAEDIFNWNYFI